jgi:uncharacterized FAD-dependent dehydrogenase
MNWKVCVKKLLYPKFGYDLGIYMNGLRKTVKNADRIVGLRVEIRARDLLQNTKHSTAMFGKTKKQEKRNISKEERRKDEQKRTFCCRPVGCIVSRICER